MTWVHKVAAMLGIDPIHAKPHGHPRGPAPRAIEHRRPVADEVVDAKTWTAGELVAELRHLDPDMVVHLRVGEVAGVRVVRATDGGRVAYIEGAPL